MVQNLLKWFITCPKWVKIVQTAPKFSKIDQYDIVWSNIGLIWSTFGLQNPPNGFGITRSPGWSS